MAKHVFLLAGEQSGDNLGANLVREIKAQSPDTKLTAIGGDGMQAAGATLITHIRELNVMGFVEVLLHLPKIFRVYKRVKQHLIATQPDWVILIDYAGFNLKVAKLAKSLGIKVCFYVSPKVWAWKAGRIAKIKASVDLMAVLFPFEVPIYEKAGVPVMCVGHPLALNINHTKQDTGLTIGILPGSRTQELKRLMPTLLACVKQTKATRPSAKFILPIAPNRSVQDFSAYDLTDIELTNDSVQKVSAHLHCAIVCSGTTTLELALHHVPMVIVYKTSWLSYQIAKRVVRIPWIGLCNIVAEKLICPELIQHDATPEKICAALEPLLADSPEHQAQMNAMEALETKVRVEAGNAKLVDSLAI